MIKKITLLLTAIVFSIYLNAQSFSALYTFDSVKTTSGLSDPSSVPTATGVTFGSFSATGASANPNATARFSFTGWSLGSVNSDSLYSEMTGTINTAQYYEITITPNATYTIDLDSITFSIQRSGTGIRTYVVRSSADGYATNLAASINQTSTKLSVLAGDIFFWNKDLTTSNQNGSKITLGGAGFTALASAITFRFYAWNAEASGGTFSIDNVMINGTASQATAINSNKIEKLSTVYPNPSANGLFTVDMGNGSGKTILTVYNIIGNVLLEKEINASGKQMLDLSNQANGSYFIKIKNDNSNTIKKIIIDK